MILEGHYQHPGRAAREAASLLLSDSGEGITLQTAGGNRLFSLPQVVISDALGSIPLTLTFPDGGRFVPVSDEAFRQWLYRRRSPGLVHRLERHKRGVALALLMTLLAVLSYIYVVLPWASGAIALRIPSVAEQRLGEHTLTLLRESGFADSKLPERRQKEVQALFRQAMPPQMQQERTPLTLHIMAAPIGPNAFMLADGSLIVSDDLVKLAKSDDALVSVMLHEMGHHAGRHPMRMVVRSSLVALTMMWMTGDVSGIGDTLLQSASFLHEMQFSRGMEREADAWAIAEMRRQGRSLAAMEQIFRALQDDEPRDKAERSLDFPEWMSTHPDMQARLETIRAAAAEQKNADAAR